MKAIIHYYEDWEVPHPLNLFTSLPVLYMTIHGAPHKRQHRKVLQKYREDLYEIASRRDRGIINKIDLPINHEIYLWTLYTNPNSPDLDHTEEALFMALDGKSLSGPSILTDDRMIQGVTKNKFYSNPPTKRDNPNR